MTLQLYKHVRNTDVAFRLEARIRTPEGHKLKVTWWNVTNPKAPFPIISDKIFIKNADLKDWKQIIYA